MALSEERHQERKKKTFVWVGRAGSVHSASNLCAVSAWLRIAQRWVDLKLTDDHPLAVFTDSGDAAGKLEFIRPTHINHALRSAATAVYNVTDPNDLARFSSHSIRVGACVALHAAGVQQQDIKFALRWKSDSFYTYLRNLPCQAARMATAVLNFHPQRFTLVPDSSIAYINVLPALSLSFLMQCCPHLSLSRRLELGTTNSEVSFFSSCFLLCGCVGLFPVPSTLVRSNTGSLVSAILHGLS